MAARLQWDCEYTTRLWQGCDKLVTTLLRNGQCGCKVAEGLWKYYKVMTRLWQGCDNLVKE